MEEHWYLFSFCLCTEAAGIVNHPVDNLCRRWNTFFYQHPIHIINDWVIPTHYSQSAL